MLSSRDLTEWGGFALPMDWAFLDFAVASIFLPADGNESEILAALGRQKSWGAIRQYYFDAILIMPKFTCRVSHTDNFSVH